MPAYVVSPHQGHARSHSMSRHSPQPIVYTTSQRSHHSGHTHSGHGHSNGGYYEYPTSHSSGQYPGTPLQRYASVGHTPPHSNPAYLTIPSNHHRSRSHSAHRDGHSHSHGHHDVQYYTAPTRTRSRSRTRHRPSASAPQTYSGGSRPVYTQYADTGRHRGDYRRHQSDAGHYRSTLSWGERLRRFFGLSGHHEPHHHHRRNHSARKGFWFFGPVNRRGYVNGHGRDVDHRGRQIIGY